MFALAPTLEQQCSRSPHWSELSTRHLGLLLASIWKQLPDQEKRLILVSHARTYTAREKQSVLPSGLVVQKTVTVLIDGRLLLITGLGDFHISKEQKKALGRLLLDSKKMKSFTINPPAWSAQEVSGLPLGMVSPFLPPGHTFAQLEAIVVLQETIESLQGFQAAVSISLESSVLVPAAGLIPVIQKYCLRYVPSIPVVVL